MRFAIRITVKKTLFHADLIDEYEDTPSDWSVCPLFREGDVCVVEADTPWVAPEGFCGWAWADLQKTVWGMSRGGPERFMTCCTDGYRPVVFLLERITP